jgi:hypothetical protein
MDFYQRTKVRSVARRALLKELKSVIIELVETVLELSLALLHLLKALKAG